MGSTWGPRGVHVGSMVGSTWGPYGSEQRWVGSREVVWGGLGWFEVEWGVVCEWDVPLSMLGKSLKGGLAVPHHID